LENAFARLRSEELKRDSWVVNSFLPPWRPPIRLLAKLPPPNSGLSGALESSCPGILRLAGPGPDANRGPPHRIKSSPGPRLGSREVLVTEDNKAPSA
jgi:hypothetical protein